MDLHPRTYYAHNLSSGFILTSLPFVSVQFDVIDKSCVAIRVMIGNVDGNGEGVGKGTNDYRVFCVFSICFLIIVDFNKLQGFFELLEGDTTIDKI